MVQMDYMQMQSSHFINDKKLVIVNLGGSIRSTDGLLV